MKKVLSLILAILIMASLMTSCVQSGPGATQSAAEAENPGAAQAAEPAPSVDIDESKVDAETSGTLTHWVWGDYEIKGAKDFTLYYPNVEVNYVSISTEEYPQKLQTTAASGAEMPDVVNFEMTPRGMLLNIDAWERLDAEPYNLDRNDIVDFAIPLISNKKDEIVSVQIDNCVGGFAYNRELAKKYFGTDDPAEMEKIFTSLDVFVEKGKEISEKSGGQDLLFAGSDDAFNTIKALFTSEPWVVDNKMNFEPTIMPAFELIERMVSYKSIGSYQQWTPAWNASFAANNILFYGAPSWFMTFAMKANDKDSVGKWGFMSPPGGGFSWGGTAYGIPKKAKPENKELAWKYIKWFTLSMEGSRCFVREQVTPTLYQPAIGTDVYQPFPDPYFGGIDVFSKLLEISENPNTKVRPMTEFDRTIDVTATQILREMDNGMSAVDALAKLKEEVKKVTPELTV